MKKKSNKFYGFIYKTILPDGRYYIGQHKIINHQNLDDTYFGSGVIIKDYIRSKGKQGLKREILAFGDNHQNLNLLEDKFLTEDILSDPLNINLDTGGKHLNSRTDAVKTKIGKSIKIKRKENPEKWPSRKGELNNRSKQWKLISPDGEEFILNGNLKEFCESKGISANTIKAAIKEGWIPKRGKCSGWKAYDLTTGKSTYRDTLNHGESHSGNNNPWHKQKLKENNNDN